MTASESPTFSRNLLFLSVAILLSAAAVGLQRALWGIHSNWSSVYGHFAHGYLVLLMSLWLAWQAWRRRTALRVSPWWPALGALLLLLALLVVSMQLGVESLLESLVPAILLAAVAGVFGLQSARVLLWPILFLFCGMPIWWVLNTPLQDLTIAIVNPLVRLSGVPAFIEGNQFHFPSGVIEIASLCSGLNYMVAAISLALFQGMLYLRDWRSRFKLVALSAAVALLANWTRVYSLMLIGYYSEMQSYLIRVEHIYYGWVLFMLFLWPVFLYGARLESAEKTRLGPLPEPTDGGAIRAAALQTMLATAVAAVLLLLPALVQSRLTAAAVPENRLPPLAGPGDSTSALVVGLADTLRVPGALEERGSLYIEGHAVEVYRARYALGSSGPDTGSAIELLGSRWRPTSALTQGREGALSWQQQKGRVGDRIVLARSGLAIAGASVLEPSAAKRAALQGLLRLRGDGQLWLLAVACRDDCGQEAQVLDTVLERHGAALVANQKAAH
jgi:exosortase